jgi:hypothetical protein
MDKLLEHLPALTSPPNRLQANDFSFLQSNGFGEKNTQILMKVHVFCNISGQ